MVVEVVYKFLFPVIRLRSAQAPHPAATAAPNTQSVSLLVLFSPYLIATIMQWSFGSHKLPRFRFSPGEGGKFPTCAYFFDSLDLPYFLNMFSDFPSISPLCDLPMLSMTFFDFPAFSSIFLHYPRIFQRFH